MNLLTVLGHQLSEDTKLTYLLNAIKDGSPMTFKACAIRPA